MNDDDLEDIESQLYSQIYHNTNEEPQESFAPPASNTTTPITTMKNPGRYFGSWGPTSKFQKGSSTKQKTPQIRNNSNKTEGVYSKRYGKSRKSEVAINQVVVVSPKRPIVCLAPQPELGAYWREKFEALKTKKKKKRAKKLPPNNKVKNAKLVNKDAVITVSDSEDDSCVLVENDWPLMSVVDSEDEENIVENVSKPPLVDKNSSEGSDDVIFVEPVNASVEVINIDEDSQTSASKNSPQKNKVEQQIHQERKELLSTPDSASNDFMNNSGVELSQKNFNFSLHGSDFNSGVFTKPSNPTDKCETESSSSTTEANSVNLMKTIVFNEVEFPKEDIFAEGNLERFSNLITPSRNSASHVTTSPTSGTTSNDQHKNTYSSESSESDFEDPQIDNQKNKNLPVLSHFNNVSPKRKKDDEQEKNKGKCKKKKKNKEVEEELKQKKRRSDNMEGSDGDSETPSKKKSKNKKRKSDVTVVTEGEVTIVEAKEATQVVAEEKIDGAVTDVQTKENNVSVVKAEQAVETVRNEDNTEQNVSKEREKSANGTPDLCVALEGFSVVDETFNDSKEILSSDSESVLSVLNEEHNIQINIENQPTPENAPVTTNSENFSVRVLQQKMSDDPNLWNILDSDRMPPARSRGRRCNKCREIGHGPLRCPKKRYPKCQLCGQEGHYEPRCPNKLCTQCGQKSNYLTNYCGACFKYRNFRCHLCSLMGHIAEKCPDLWRRYHLTTNEGTLNSYDGPFLKSKEELWCSGCACNGHLEHDCEFFKSLYPPSDPYIKSYENIYDEDNRGGTRNMNLENQQQQNQHPSPLLRFELNNPNVTPIDQSYPNVFGNMNNYYNNPQFNYQLTNMAAHLLYNINNQQNIFNHCPPQNNYHFNQNRLGQGQNFQTDNFDNRLPDFISLSTKSAPATNTYQEVPKEDYSGSRYYKRGVNISKRLNAVFFSSPAASLRYFIKEELQKLSKLAVMSHKVVKEFVRKQIPKRLNEREEYFQTLNMLLFGVFNLIEGKIHVERLKKFKMEMKHCKVTQRTRQRLYASFLYIFANSPHEGVNYIELLRRL